MSKYSDNSKFGDDLEVSPIQQTVLAIDEHTQQGSYDPAAATHRGLRPRHIQLIAISGAIGAGVFISIGGPLSSGGPLGLLIGLSMWCFVIWCFSNCVIEMCTLLPVSGGYIHYAGRFLDPSARFAAGYNTILGGISFVCFELTAMHVVLQYWHPDLNPAITISCGLIGLALANGISVRVYGEIEFWISILKVILMLGLFLFTFITMVGGNPIGDKYGFRFWRDPGVFAKPDGVGRLRGVWAGVTWGAFAVAGPDFLSVVAAETKDPRRVLPKCFNATIFRVIFFYLGSALAVSINCPSNAEELLGGLSNAGRSPYIINMNRLLIPALPSLVNGIVFTSIFSTGSSFMFTSSRMLYTLACHGQAPKILRRTNRYGTPYLAVAIVVLVSCLSYLTLSSQAGVVLVWFTNMTTACTLMTWIVIGMTYIRFRAGLKAQGVEEILPVRGYFQPYSAWIATIAAIFTLIFSGSYLFAPGGFTIPDVIFSYFGAWFFIFNFCLWKVKGLLTKTQRGFGISKHEMDFVSDLDEIEQMTEYEKESRETRDAPANLLQKVDRVLFEGKF